MKIYLTNAASRKPPHRGPGRVWTIMAAPRRQFGEAGEGWVPSLLPNLDHLLELKAGDMTLGLYRGIYQKDLKISLRGQHLTHPYLVAEIDESGALISVADGDTLICCCSRAAAAEGRCHRAWAAEALKEAGWTVVLDGVAL